MDERKNKMGKKEDSPAIPMPMKEKNRKFMNRVKSSKTESGYVWTPIRTSVFSIPFVVIKMDEESNCGYGYSYLLKREVPNHFDNIDIVEGFYKIVITRKADNELFIDSICNVSAAERDEEFTRGLKKFLIGRFK